MKRRVLLAFVTFGLAIFAVCVGQAKSPKDQNAPPAKSSKPAPSEGEKRFRTNCGRCHNPPEDISPREARAVVRQMRVRAMLSAEDEKLILAYLAP